MNKKRLVALVLAVVLLASLIVGILPHASAAAYTISLRDGSGNNSVTVKPGDTVELYVKLSDNPGIISAGVQVSYPAGIALTKSANAVSGGNFDVSWGNSSKVTANPYLVWMNVATGTEDGKLVTYNGNIRKLTFQVTKDADNGTYAITLKAPADKNLTAGVDGSGVIKPNTNSKVTPAVSGFTITVQCNHAWSDWRVTENVTCDKDGKEVRNCSNCLREEERTNKATGHNFGSWTTTKNAACDVAGEQTRSCQNAGCTHKETKAIAAIGHKFGSWSQTKAPDCTTAGEEKRTCQNAGCTHSETRAIKALGHSFSKPTVTKQPTCTQPGVQSGKCSRCNKEATDSVPATGHSYGSWTVTKEPTCTSTGVKTSTCTKCNAQKTDKVVAAGHKFSNPKITKQPTCLQPGTQTGKCENCGKTSKEEVPATGHKYAEAQVTKEATCAEAGAKTQICEYCKDAISTEIPALGHEFGEGSVTQETSLSVPGVLTSKCVRCEETKQTEIPCKHADAATGIILEAETGVVQPGALVTITQLTAEVAEYEAVKLVISQVSSKFVVFDISTVLDGVQVQPDGKIKASFPIPEGFSQNLGLYYVSDDGQMEFIPGVVSQDGKCLEVELSHFSYYVLCDLDAQPEATVDMQQIYILVICVASLLLLCVLVIIIVAIAKRKDKETQEVEKQVETQEVEEKEEQAKEDQKEEVKEIPEG